MIENSEIQLSAILSEALSLFAADDRCQPTNDMVDALCAIYNHDSSKLLTTFCLDESSSLSAMHEIEAKLDGQSINIQSIRMSTSYLLDEIICNMQQHSQAKEGYVYAKVNEETQTVDLLMADAGIGIYGSYVNAQKHTDLIGNSDAEAINIAKDGYSTKNLPNAENRGYGISSNIKMVVEGLGGQFCIFSGSALFLATPESKKILSLPDIIDWKGTMVIVRIPCEKPSDFNFYDYIV
ncbi:MAG: hypothetical protein MJZ08_09670 [Bacteroidaceae bacterium]|nr:hypothetical protein [Bacteroidaceae bacterium]